MVNEKILVKDKYRLIRKFLIFSIAIVSIAIILLAAYFVGVYSKNNKQEIVLENPLKNIVFSNTNEAGIVNREAATQQALIEFNEEYITYILASLGANKLYKSPIGYGPARIELIIDNEIWSATIDKSISVSKTNSEDPDLRITIPKKIAVEALLSENIKSYLESSVRNGNIQAELIAGKVELASKGYISMYTELTGEEITVD